LNLSSPIVPTITLIAITCQLGCSTAPLTREESDAQSQKFYSAGLKELAEDNENKAVEQFRKAIDLNPYSVSSYAALASIELKSENYQSVETLLRTAPSHPTLRYYLGCSYFRLGKFNESISVLEEISDSDSNFFPARFVLAQMYEQSNNYAQSYNICNGILASGNIPLQEPVLSLREKLLSDHPWLDSAAKSSGITRASFARICRKYFEDVLPSDTSRLVFIDVSRTDSSYKDCAGAVAMGILEQLPDHKFHPSHLLKRRNAAFYFNRILTRMSIRSAQTERTWIDLSNADPQKEAIEQVAAAGIFNVYRENEFRPNDYLSENDAILACMNLRSLLK